MFLFPRIAEAHVRYIADDATVENLSGLDFSYLFSALSDPKNLTIIGVSIAVLVLLVLLLPKIGFLRRKLSFINAHAESYHSLVPWMARLSLGIGLIGAGTAGYLINPVVETLVYSQVQIIAGFLLMAGFLNVLVVPFVIYLFVVAFLQDWYLIGALDVLALLLLLFVYDARRPGIDEILGIPDIAIAKLRSWVPRMLQIGTGTSLLFLAVYEKLLNPHLSAFVVEATNLTSVIPVSPSMWVLSAGSIEAILGLLLIIGFRVRLVSVITFIVLALSFFYFKEDVTSHITLFGVMSIIFILGNKK
jgi:uncharacterized membrane protein YphA (DoxX/SURF4 family)